MSRVKKIVVIGGGTGSFSALSGLKKYPFDLTAIVSMADSGGSSGKLRDELGVLPPGDIRQCLVALAESSKSLRELFNYRFEEGGLKGHNFGNIFLSALEKQTGSMKKAINQAGEILRIKGNVIPVSFSEMNLCVTLSDGKTIAGETHIDVVEKKEKRAKIVKAFLKPKVSLNKDASQSIAQADYILIGPGDLYTSIIPNLLVSGMPQAIRKSKAKKIFVLNLMTKYGQTTKYTATDHIADLEKYLGKNIIDCVLVNTKTPNRKALGWYEEFEEYPVKDNLDSSKGYTIIRKDLIKGVLFPKVKNDDLRRSIIRHHPDKLAKEIVDIMLLQP